MACGVSSFTYTIFFYMFPSWRAANLFYSGIPVFIAALALYFLVKKF